MDEIEPTLLEITISELEETKKKVFVMFSLSKLKNNSDQSVMKSTFQCNSLFKLIIIH